MPSIPRKTRTRRPPHNPDGLSAKVGLAIKALVPGNVVQSGGGVAPSRHGLGMSSRGAKVDRKVPAKG